MKTVILIPAYKPEESFVDFSRRLTERGHCVVAVDDGGGEAFADIFKRVGELGVKVVKHDVNRGKGRALKTGIQYITENMPDTELVVTADCDGQHRIEDIEKVIKTAEETPGVFVIGGRFRDKKVKVPFKSRLGNGFTRFLFMVATGSKIYDTQTGLRGLPAHLFPELLKVKGERYEYEMNMLLMLHIWEQDFVEIPIETVYVNNNAGTHYNPFKDSIRILHEILKFMAASMASFVIDYVAFILLSDLVFNKGGVNLATLLGLESGWFAQILATFSLAYICARIISGTFNYLLNRKIVFKKGSGSSAGKYLLLAVIIMITGALATGGLIRLGWNEYLVKILIDGGLYVFNYFMQREWVFKKSSKEKKNL
ncbi:MAG: bifunctional glycosyltransferase family 2/GtrA family protein [Clostridia bacterium]|nr:bifunctional glycosyltransferase family 2/GtrA family protein [Clostridia bacterium]